MQTADAGHADRLAEQVTARIRHLLDTCPACAERRAARAAAPKLSPRRRQMLTLASQGMTFDQIARELLVSRATVAKTLATAREALGAIDTTNAVAIAIRLGVIE